MSSDHHLPRPEHWEAVRLSWQSRHVPVGSLLLGALLLASVMSAVSMVWAYGPVNVMP
jgi:hypothetical protein